jgi:competence ComEA-like helix-hairpin-helix protein
MIKPGYRTTEFWFTLVSFIFSGLFLLGIIPEHDTKEDLIRDISHGVESIILISAQLAIFYRYISSRQANKAEYEKTKQLEEENNIKEIEDFVGIDRDFKNININTATLGELIQLPHIGTVLARSIIDYRSNVGFFENTEDILKINGIGINTYHDIKNHINV